MSNLRDREVQGAEAQISLQGVPAEQVLLDKEIAVGLALPAELAVAVVAPAEQVQVQEMTLVAPAELEDRIHGQEVLELLLAVEVVQIMHQVLQVQELPEVVTDLSVMVIKQQAAQVEIQDPEVAEQLVAEPQFLEAVGLES
jgi:hypothetical protein